MSNLELWKLFVHYVKDLQPIIAIRNNYMDLGIKMGIWLFHQAIQKCKISMTDWQLFRQQVGNGATLTKQVKW